MVAQNEIACLNDLSLEGGRPSWRKKYWFTDVLEDRLRKDEGHSKESLK